MVGYVGASRIVIVVVLALLLWTELHPGREDVSYPTNLPTWPDHPIGVASGGGSTLASSVAHPEEVIVVRHQMYTASPTTVASTPTRPPVLEPPPAALATPQPLGLFTVTAYSDSVLNGTDGRGITRSGERTRWGVVAVDPQVIPLGSGVVIEGMGETLFTALDTGGGVIGRWVDIWFPTDREALRHGVKKRLVYMLPRWRPAGKVGD